MQEGRPKQGGYMKIVKILVVVCLAACIGFVLAPLGRTQAPSPANADALLAASTTGGKVVFNFTLTVNSVIPKNAVIACEAHIDINESSGQSITEKGFVLAHLVSGNQWACSVVIPYSWVLATPTTDKARLSYKIAIADALQLTATNSTATTVLAPLAPREADQGIAFISIPLNGATTTETVNVTL
jgi:hypothetical protein